MGYGKMLARGQLMAGLNGDMKDELSDQIALELG